jgi:sodium/potassium-transporting ATPase subunit alpha
MASITGMIPAETLVLREGLQNRIPASDLVVGDIIYLKLGNKCPADCRIIDCSGDLKFDRSVLTGESEPIAATPENTDPNFMESRNIGTCSVRCPSFAFPTRLGCKSWPSLGLRPDAFWLNQRLAESRVPP